MVRWVKEGDTCKPEFSVMDRYLDLAQKYMHPRVVFFYLWDRLPGFSPVGGEGRHATRRRQGHTRRSRYGQDRDHGRALAS